jgi:hypothetical protein
MHAPCDFPFLGSKLSPLELEDQSRVARFLSRLTIVFVTVWAVRALVVTGNAVLNEPFRHYLLTPPSLTQARAGTSFDQSLIQIDHRIPKTIRVAVIWSDPRPDPYAAYAFSSYFLFPRPITLAKEYDPRLDNQADALIFVEPPDQSPPRLPSFTRRSVDEFRDIIVFTYERASG